MGGNAAYIRNSILLRLLLFCAVFSCQGCRHIESATKRVTASEIAVKTIDARQVKTDNEIKMTFREVTRVVMERDTATGELVEVRREVVTDVCRDTAVSVSRETTEAKSREEVKSEMAMTMTEKKVSNTRRPLTWFVAGGICVFALFFVYLYSNKIRRWKI